MRKKGDFRVKLDDLAAFLGMKPATLRYHLRNREISRDGVEFLDYVVDVKRKQLGERLYTPAELAYLLGVSVRSIYYGIRRGMYVTYERDGVTYIAKNLER